MDVKDLKEYHDTPTLWWRIVIGEFFAYDVDGIESVGAVFEQVAHFKISFWKIYQSMQPILGQRHLPLHQQNLL